VQGAGCRVHSDSVPDPLLVPMRVTSFSFKGSSDESSDSGCLVLDFGCCD
jgi:hypothetical protein